MHPLTSVRWRTSSRSANGGQCVEIGQTADVVGIRDTKDRQGGVITVAPRAFDAFLAAAKDDRLS
ncbi:hypothetical protein FHR81_001840 [Actinoalloteichus hoggarensis]|uniref:Uncharacterized protein n=1 Tax=Actinoalloteichus hoggarensis TaxID=1470176 RepID=A0A221W5C7_9PSEU|nr:DUF397 domain-containing protein [Actinoalloteichus hoggarensis]ASO20871.1 hypothetical protein AHOG_16225 [Actinoalloteichus hoggarensis]MBB5920802.1 hypothetical protein [Actinoalloteichus hoggarensis]